MAKTNPIKPFPTDIDREVFGHWLSGFVDGEGCFLLYFSPDKTPYARARFLINLRYDDFAILQTIQSFFACGSLHKCSHVGNSKPQARFFIDRVHLLLDHVAPHFESHPLRAKKSRDFKIWTEGLHVLREIGSRRRRGRPCVVNGGSISVWTPSDKAAFLKIVLALKKTREFVDTSPLTEPLSNPGFAQATLFSFAEQEGIDVQQG